ncbi:MAG: DUF2330 domain-containing protein [Myxococcaceae bacterium]
MRAFLVAVLLTLPLSASAFCGFYVSGAGGKLFNDASAVVLVRDGTRTVLSMQNNYRGPVENFAMVVPVPVVLSKDNVKTLPRPAFRRLDELSSPRLVAVPKDPCETIGIGGIGTRGRGGGTGGYGSGVGTLGSGVTVEAKFNVEEYEIVILSAKDSTGLETWLKQNRYQVPEGAAELLRPYVQTGSKFFVAKINAKKAKFENGQLVLSPLRFHYDSETFSLPVRLGLVNSGGTQDLIVHVIAKDRYELANAKNVFVPTNVDVSERAEAQFGGFYKELLSRTFKKFPGAAVTEFAWKGALPPPTHLSASGIYGVTCDPCPPPHPVDDPLARYLGVDLLPNVKTDEDVAAFAREATITRLHLRYTKDSAPDDLVFKVATPVRGGVPDVKGAMVTKTNRFQARYLMWVDGCAALSSMGNMFGGSSSVGAVGAQTNAVELVDDLEQVITSEVRELGLEPRPLPKDPKPLPAAPPPTPPDDDTTWVDVPRVEPVAETPVVESGKLDPELIKMVVHRNRGQLRYCWESYSGGASSFTGTVTVRAVISHQTGAVTSAQLVSSTLNLPAASDCMVSRVKTWMFPKPKDGQPVTVSVPITFKPKSR